MNARAKRGMIELPALAIFTIVAGALIVLFFVVLTQGQSEASSRDLQAASLQRLDALIKAAATARETQNNITIINEPLAFTCDQAGLRFGYDSNIELPLYNQVIFSANRLDGGELRTYTLGSDSPFRVANILYVWSESVLISNRLDNRYTDLLDKFPPNLPFVIESAGSTVRRVLPFDYNGMGTTSDVRIERDGTNEFGAFYYGNIENKVIFPNKELLYGAIIAKDKQTYNCVFDAYLTQLKWVSDVEKRRTERLRDEASLACKPLYVLTPYDTIAGLPDAAEFTVENARSLDNAQKQLAFMNEELIRGDACAWLY